MKAIAVILVLGLSSIAVILMAESDGAITTQVSKKRSDEYQGPIVDYGQDYQAAATTDLKERELRLARGGRYGRRAPQPLGELPSNWEDFGISNDWYIGLPALPVGKSDLIIVGEVVAANAHLSNDKTAVYSEFSIRVDEVLKNQAYSPLNVNDVTLGEREGGVVRFQTGRLLRYVIYHQGMPSPGRQYLFFLSRNKQEEDNTIITAYELSNGRVFPLDESKAFSSYDGVDEQQFLRKVRREITRETAPSKARKEERR